MSNHSSPMVKLAVSNNTRSAGSAACGGTVILYTKADSEREIHLKNIKNAREVKDLISKLVEDARDKKKVVGKEFFDENLNFEDHSE